MQRIKLSLLALLVLLICCATVSAQKITTVAGGGPFASGSLFETHADDLSLPYALGTHIALRVHQAPKDLA